MLDIQKFLWKPQIEVKKNDNITSFTFGPLPAGLWHSLGNMLRRTILAYTPAISITWIQIEWVSHEYSNIEWVKESVLQILLNFKDLKFSWDLEETPLWVSKTIKGIGKYSVEDLDLPAGVEILTDGKYLFEITDPKTELKISYRFEKWYRYLSLEDLKKRERQLEESEEWKDLNVLLIDNDFKVVNNVSYSVEEVMLDFSSEPNDYVTLNIEPISDKIDAKDLVAFAGEVVSSYAKVFVFDDAYIDESLFVDSEDLDSTLNQEVEVEEIKKTPIDSLTWLSERTRNALIKNNIEFVEDLEKTTRSELLSLKWVGKKAVDEIQEALEKEWRQLGTNR